MLRPPGGGSGCSCDRGLPPPPVRARASTDLPGPGVRRRRPGAGGAAGCPRVPAPSDPAERRAVPLMAACLAALAWGSPTQPPLHFDGGSSGSTSPSPGRHAPCDCRQRAPPSPGPRSGGGPVLRRPGQLHQGDDRLGPLGRPARDAPLAVPGGRGGGAAFFCFQRALQTNRPLTAIAVMEAGAGRGRARRLHRLRRLPGREPGDPCSTPAASSGSVSPRGASHRLRPGWPSQPTGGRRGLR